MVWVGPGLVKDSPKTSCKPDRNRPDQTTLQPACIHSPARRIHSTPATSLAPAYTAHTNAAPPPSTTHAHAPPHHHHRRPAATTAPSLTPTPAAPAPDLPTPTPPSSALRRGAPGAGRSRSGAGRARTAASRVEAPASAPGRPPAARRCTPRVRDGAGRTPAQSLRRCAGVRG